MMRKAIVILLLFNSLNSFSQERMSFSIGIPANYYFDDFGFNFHQLNSLPLPTDYSLSYSVSKRQQFTVNYNYFRNRRRGLDVYEGKILVRYSNTINLAHSYFFCLGNKVRLKSLLGINYRFLGSEISHLKFIYGPNGFPIEEKFSVHRFNDVGVSFGLGTEIRLYKNIFISSRHSLVKYKSQNSDLLFANAIMLGLTF